MSLIESKSYGTYLRINIEVLPETLLWTFFQIRKPLISVEHSSSSRAVHLRFSLKLSFCGVRSLFHQILDFSFYFAMFFLYYYCKYVNFLSGNFQRALQNVRYREAFFHTKERENKCSDVCWSARYIFYLRWCLLWLIPIIFTSYEKFHVLALIWKALHIINTLHWVYMLVNLLMGFVFF